MVVPVGATNASHMRQRIVQMAHTLFVQQGVEETTMVAIAEAVGCRDVYKRQLRHDALVELTRGRVSRAVCWRSVRKLARTDDPDTLALRCV